MNHAKIIKKLQSSLTPDLLSKQWRGSKGVAGHCYIAAESLYWIIGGPKSGYKPYVLTNASWPEGLNAGETHWFLSNGKNILDPTKEQFDIPIRYDLARCNGFLTNKPSKRANIVIERVNKKCKRFCHTQTLKNPSSL